VRSQLVSPTLPGRLVQYCHDDYRDGLRAPDRIEGYSAGRVEVQGYYG